MPHGRSGGGGGSRGTWLVRRAQRRLGPQLGELRYVARSWGVHWGAFVPCLLIGFVYGAYAEYVSFTTRVPNHFTDIPLYMLVSTLSGLVLFAITFAWSMRTILLFDGGLVTGFSQWSTTRVIGWHTVPATSVQVLWTEAATIGRVVRPRDEALFRSIGVKGRFGVVFCGVDVAAHPQGQTPAEAPVVRTFLFAHRTDLAPLVHTMAALMRARGVPGAESLGRTALPPTTVEAPVVVG